MGWTLAKSLDNLRNEVNAKFPKRSRISDGTIGDAAHARVPSDHNPNAQGVVTALDLTHDPANGFDAHAVADELLAKRHPALKYLISNRRIAGDWTNWQWRVYSGSNAHTRHIHVSVGVGDDGKSTGDYDNTSPWGVTKRPSAPSPAPQPVPVQTGVGRTVHLPASAQTWAAYRVGSQYRKHTTDQVGTLMPAYFGGLTYPILEERGPVVVIQTQSFGRVAIWVQGTEAVFSGSSAVPKKNTVHFPRTAPSWAVYRPGSGYRKGTSDQVGSILPALFGGLTYPIVEHRGNVVIIDTQSYGRVAAWVQGTEAVIN